MRTILLVLVSVLAQAGCKPAGPATMPVTEPASAEGTTPTDPTQTDPPQTEPTPGAPTCASDKDCVITCAQPRDCCDQLCEPCGQAMHQDELAAHQAWRAKSCSADRCPVARCRPPTDRTVARCKAGACVVERLPL